MTDAPRASKGPAKGVLVTAHRGSSAEAPENTLAAIRLAIAQGADWVEIDVQEARDGTLVVLHDADLLRVAGDPRAVWELGRADLAKLEAGAWFSEQFDGEPIPTLAEVLDLARGQVGLNIELKLHGHERRLVEGTLDLLQAANVGGHYMMTSLEIDALRRVKALAPKMRVGWIVETDPGDPRSLDLDALSLHFPLATPELIRACQAAQVETHVWTVNDRSEMVRLIGLGVTSIITDTPAILRQVLAEGT